MMKLSHVALVLGTLSLAVSLQACSSDDSSGDGDGSGGSTSATGGSTAASGGTGTGSGGENTGSGGDTSGSGGSTSTGGAGTGGSSNPNAVVSECPQSMGYTVNSTQSGACMTSEAGGPVADFEMATQAEWFGIYANGTAGTTTDPAAWAEGNPVNRVSGGANGSGYSVHYAGSGFSGGGVRLNTAFKYDGGGTCKDVSTFEGISFWAKGSVDAETGGWTKPENTLVVLLGTQHTVPTAEGGDCADGCYEHPDAEVTISADWKEYKIPFDCFGNLDSFDGHVLSLLVHARGETFDFSIDEINFY